MILALANIHLCRPADAGTQVRLQRESVETSTATWTYSIEQCKGEGSDAQRSARNSSREKKKTRKRRQSAWSEEDDAVLGSMK